MKFYRNLNLSVFAVLLLLSTSVFAFSLPDFTPLVEKNAAAVVNISTTLKKTDSGKGLEYHMPDIPEDSPFYDFFRRFFDEMPGDGMQPFEKRSSLGSGFILSKDGYVITNNHVVKDADEVVVTLQDRREFIAEMVGTDGRSDIAVLKIKGENLPTIKLGDSDDLKVGEWVLAIGSPFGFDHTVTAGIVSAIGRSLPNENYVPFIQTDVAINPGNSGGPLFNMDGEVIGVNSQIYSRTGGFMGLSFAVPINVVTNVYEQLKTQGHVSRGWLGVLIQDVTRELAESFGMKRPQGALIAKVLSDGPAEKAGLEVGDIVLKFDGQEVRYSSDLPPLVGSSKVGERIPLEIIRRGKSKTLYVVIAELPNEKDIVIADSGKDNITRSNALNIIVTNLTDEQREDLGIEDHGVLVAEVRDGPGKKAGIRRGDVVLLINNVKVNSSEHFSKLVKELPRDKSIPILLQRRGGPIFIALKLSND
ncbi:MAG: DegQ family serine endoprotease [Gammaproteobacteria bacterium]|nr:Do family serine endopeptidase [Gammaproteobacteria bacterium]NIN62060.1 Do family serine endopeptidase [Gammaproteobacteria bacterium]NIO62139.1 Do family serine endopeptidase [Gammaproteobacteria bacterium]NIQ08251.1 DegQ family serine endoprotease [Gammaproteobacteria bacterium]NIQ19851.1 Do family serine endopeptidase [Gammaproteobacteria bacterium]